MRVAVLGPVLADVDGEWKTVGTPRERALLTLLALEAPRPVHRDELIDLLWDDDPPASAVKTLQAHISRLRRSSGLSIGSSGTSYVLEIASAAIDAHEYERLVEAAVRPDVPPDLAARELDAALAMWRQAPFVEFSQTPRAASESARFVELHLVAREARFDAALALGDAAQVVPDLTRFCEQHPLRERAWGQLMTALHATGRSSDALRAFQRARSMLIEQLGVEPSDELRSLDQRIAAGEDLGVAATAPASPSLAVRTAEVVELDVGPTHLVGRDRELVDVEEWSSSGSAMLSIEGEPGIGKTSLMRAARVHLGDALMLSAEAMEGLGGGLGPIAALVDELLATEVGQRALMRSDDPAAVVALTPAAAPLVGRGTPISGEQSSHRLVAAFVQLMTDAAAERPLVLAVDDLQWCGAASLAALRQLLRTTAPAVRLMATVRSVDRGADADFRRFDLEIERDVDVVRLELAGLDAGAVAQVLDDGRELDAGVASDLCELSGGHPLFVMSILHGLDAAGQLVENEHGRWVTTTPPGELGQPAAVRRMVERRLAESGSGDEIVPRVAVLGPEIDEDLCVEVVGVGADQLLDALENAVAVELMDLTDAGGFRFRHELVRLALAEGVSVRRATELHRRAFDLLAASRRGRDLQRAVAHGVAGDVESERLLDTTERAADHARSSVIPTDEVDYRRLAVALLTEMGDESSRRVRAEIDLGVAMVHAGAGEETLAPQRAAAVRAAQRAADPHLTAEAALYIGMDYSVGPAPERVPELTAAREALRDVDPDSDLAIEVDAGLAAQLWSRGNHELRGELIWRALDATAGRADLTRCRVLSSATWALPGVSTIEQRQLLATELVTLAESQDLPLQAATGLNALAAAALGQGDHHGGLDAARRLSGLRSRYRLPALRLIDVSLQAGMAILHGELDDAWEMIHEAIEMADDHGVAALGLGPVGRPIIELAADRGAVPRIPAHLFQFGDMLDSYPPYRMSKLYARVFLGDPTASDDIALEAENIADFPPDIGHLFAANRLAATIDLADAAVDDRHVVEVLMQYEGEVDWSGSASSGPASLWLAVLARRRGEVDPALGWLAEAERLADALDAPLWRSRIARERALLSRIGGPPAPDAAETARELAASAGAQLITHLLDRDGL